MKLWFIATLKVIGKALFKVVGYTIIAFGVLLLLAILSAIPIVKQILDVIMCLILFGVVIFLIIAIIIAIKEAIEDEYNKLKRKDD